MKRVVLVLLFGCILLPSVAFSDFQKIPGLNAREIHRILRAKRKNPSANAISDQCSSIKEVNFLIKADTSNHIGNDSRVGAYSVIGSPQNCSPCKSGLCSILYQNGEEAGRIGYYGPWSRSHGGNGCSRYYGGAGGAPHHSANSIISKARRLGTYLYLKSGSTCYRWQANLRRIGHT